jgi:polysaccharide deacetylase 2 family uncharacterized protein YibQ
MAGFLLLLIAASLVAVLLLLPPAPREGKAPGHEQRAPGQGEAREEQEGGAGEGRPAGVAAGRAVEAPPERPPREARIALVIDDVGYDLDSLREFLRFPGPLVFAVLPGLPGTAEAVRLIRTAGKEYLLHLPMEPLNGENPGPGAILTTQSDAEIRRLIEEDFVHFEDAVGVNNHMGSKASADARVMRVLMEILQERDKLFLDSRTTAESVAGAQAERYGVPFLERAVFVDNETDPASLRAALLRGAAVARERGQAVLIGHIRHPEILTVLQEVLEEPESRDVRLLSLGEMSALGAGP